MSQDQPNILLITTDQQRFDTVGERAPGFMRTPHFDMLAREGITFSRAYADCPICVPSRVSIMTGKTIFNHGMTYFGDTATVIDRNTSLPGSFRQLGYQTAAVGKMHFGPPERVRHGFDEMILPADYYLWMTRSGIPYQPMRHGLGQNELYPGMATVPENLTLTAWTAEQCVEYIRARRDPSIPFFLWCSFTKPHPPLDPPEPYYSMYRNSPIPEPVFGDWSDDEHCPEVLKRFRQQWSNDLIPPEIIREARAAYYGLITQIDYNMGRVFAALQDMKLLKHTLILYTSDHGEMLGDHHCGGKMYFHEGSAHVPFVLRLPKRWENREHGTICDTPVTMADILPTLVTAAGGEPPDDVDGVDVLSLARNDASSSERHLIATGRIYPDGDPEYLAITDGRWKYIWYPEGGTEQLFDLDTDPCELTELAGLAAHRAKSDELKQILTRRLEHRPEFVEDGQLIVRELQGDSERDRRNRPWPGYHTEYHLADVRH
ncbi:MAG: sulfatase-like hydrolase/transferase [Chloroflexota bacterium]|nr:sulfatase-like hydrolase/transferase [Chloroflexota bacterium]